MVTIPASQPAMAGWGVKASQATHTSYVASMFMSHGFVPPAVWITVRGYSVSSQLYWPVRHHLREAKELAWQIPLTLIPLYDLILCVFALDDLTHEGKKKKKIQDSVYNPNPLHRGIWDGEALALRLQK